MLLHDRIGIFVLPAVAGLFAFVGGSLIQAQAQNSLVYVPTITTLAGTGVLGNTGDGGPATSATFGNPVSVSYDAAGNVYVADKGKNAVRKITISNNLISTVAGTGGVSGYNGDGIPANTADLKGPNEAWVVPSGDIYIADTSNNRIRKVTAATGLISTIAGNGTAGTAGDGAVQGSATEVNAPNAVTVDPAGNVFFGDNNRIREISVSTGVISTIAGTGAGSATGNNGLASAATIAGPRYLFADVYGNLFVVDRTYHTIREIVADPTSKTVTATSIIKGVAGNNMVGSAGDGGAATSAMLNTPNTVTVDPQGNIYIIDQTPNVLRVVNGASGIIYTLAGGNTTGAYLGDGGLSTSASFNGPLGLGESPSGNIDIADSSNYVVRRLTLQNNFPATNVATASAAQLNGVEAIQAVTLSSFGVTPTGEFALGTTTGCSFTAAMAADAVCSGPVTFTPGAPGLRTAQLQATDSGGSRYLLGLTGVGNAPAVAFMPGTIATIAGTGAASSSGDNGPATSATIVAPAALALDASGNLYVAGSASTVRRVAAATGVITTIAGTGTAGYTGDGGAATAATLNNPTGLAMDAGNNGYIADSGNNAIRMISGQTGLISTVAATVGLLSNPSGVAVDAAGNLYIADTGNSVLRKVNPIASYASVLAGTVGSSGFGGDNGLATLATLKAPRGVTLDAAGNIYIADTGNNVIRRITAATGVITTIAGNGSAAFAGDGGAATLASLNAPTRVVVDAAGDLYITDAGNNRIRFVSFASGNISTIAGTGTPATPFTGDGGLATAGTLNAPGGLVLDALDNAYIADTGDNRVARVNEQTTLLNFGGSNQGITSAAQSVTVTNFGNLSLTLSKIAVPSGFAQVASGGSDCSATTTLAAGSSCVIAVAFTPTAPGNYSASVTLTDNALNNTASTQSFTVTGVGDSVSVPAKVTVTAGNNQTVTPYGTLATALQVTVTDPSGNGVAGIPVTFTAPATGASGTFANATNVVTVNSGTGGVTNAPAFTANGTRGTVTVTATTATPALSASFTETIVGSPTPAVTLTYTPVATTQTYGAGLTLKATLSFATLGGNAVTGTVSFFDNGSTTAIGSGAVSNGVALFTYVPAAGAHSYTATYSGDTNFSTSSSAAAPTLTIGRLGITAAATPLSVPYGTTPSPTITGTLTGVLAADTPNVSATFSAGITPTTAVGTYAVSTTLTGSAAANYTVNSTSGTVTVTQAATSNAVTSASTNAGVGVSVTFMDTVTSSTTGIATGQVNFYDGGTTGTLLGTRSLGSGVATLATTTLSLGTHTITAVYLGSTNFAGSTSTSAFTITIANPDFTFATTGTSLSIVQGQTGQLAFAYTSTGSFAATIVPACSGLPANATCTFTPASFTPVLTGTAAATSQTGLLIITTAGPPVTQSRNLPPLHGPEMPLFAGLLGAGLLAVRRKLRARVGTLLSFAALACILGGVLGCGSTFQSLSTVVTPAGMSNVVITTTSPTVTHTSTVALTVVAR